MATFKFDEFVKNAGGGVPTVVGNEASKEYKQTSVQASPSYMSRVGGAFKQGLEQNKQGFEKAMTGDGVLSKVKGALGSGAGLINTISAPLAPVFEDTVGKGMDFAQNKLADTYGEDVERGLHEGGKTKAESVLETAVDTTTILGAVTGGPKIGKGLDKVKSGALKTVDKAVDVAETVVKKGQEMKQGMLEKNVDPRLKTSAERSETPSTKYESFLEQEKKAKGDVKADSALSTVGERIGDSFEQVVEKRRGAGERMGSELEKIGQEKVDVKPGVDSFKLNVAKEGLLYDSESGGFTAKGQTKMTATDRTILNDFANEIDKLGDGEVTVKDLDAFVSRVSKDLDLYKSKNNIIGTTNAERIIKNTLNDFKSNFDQFEDYSGARKEYADLSGFLEEGQSYLGKKTQAGDFAKDASIAKSSVQSLLNSGKKDWLARLEDLTGYSALDDSVLALQAMKDMGNPKGASLLQLISEGDIPTTQTGVIMKILDKAAEVARKKIMGTPEEQTRAFLKSIEENPKVPKILEDLRVGAKDVINGEKIGLSAKDVTKNIHPDDVKVMEDFIDNARIDKRISDAEFSMAEKLAERFGISMDKGLAKVANDFEKILKGDKKVKGTAQTGRPFDEESLKGEGAIPLKLGNPEKAFMNSKNQKQIGDTSFVIGDYGKNSISRKIKDGLEDRLPVSKIEETIYNIKEVYNAGDSSFRKSNLIHVAEMPNGEFRALVTRLNTSGQEEIISFFKIGKDVDTFIKNLKTFGTPDRNRTDILSLERSGSNPLTYGDI